MAADLRPYQEDGSVEVVGANLERRQVHARGAGLHSTTPGSTTSPTSQRFATELKHEIYGIEPGNDGNRLVLTLIEKNEFDLGNFKLVESSEQGMLAQVERAIAAKRPIVFLGWEPHPMNTRFDMRYLTGGDTSFGPNYGGATVYTNVRVGYLQECPNVGRLLRNLTFTLRGENEMMDGILERQAVARSRGRGMAEDESRCARRLVRRRDDLRRRPAPRSLAPRSAQPAARAASRAGSRPQDPARRHRRGRHRLHQGARRRRSSTASRR